MTAKTKLITYFEQSGIENTDEVIELVYQRLKEGDIKNVVVASTSGQTGLKFAKKLKNGANLVIVSTKYGSKSPGIWQFDPNIYKELTDSGHKIVVGVHALSGLEKSIGQRFSGISHTEFLAESLKSLFSPGMKVAVECTIMALDAGVISLDKTIAVGGTGAKGRGADTAVVVFPAHSNNFFDFRILEIIAKPFNTDFAMK